MSDDERLVLRAVQRPQLRLQQAAPVARADCAGGARMTAATVILLDGTEAQLDSEAHRRRGIWQ
jgi:hypothetical protein